MEIAEVKTKKKTLEAKIRGMLIDFERETKMTVISINFEKKTHYNFILEQVGKEVITKVKIGVDI